MEDRFVRNVVTEWSDIDANQHLKNTAYTDYAMTVRVQWMSASGFDMPTLLAAGIGPVSLSDSTKYLREVLLGDTLTIDMQLFGLSQDDSRFNMRHTFHKGTEICAVHEIRAAWFDLKRRRITRPPEKLATLIRGLPRTDDYKEIEPR
jgi:acyl-CoA thioester hydrolase